MVFLDRSSEPPELRPYRKDVARCFMQQALYGLPQSLALQYEAIDNLLKVGVFELRYSDIDWAIRRLQTLVREGC
jgi:hypothetical protein